MAQARRLLPGPYEAKACAALAAGPTPCPSLSAWDFTIWDPNGRSIRWSWEEFQALARDTPTVDIQCVTKWSKIRSRWEGVPVDTLLAAAASHGVRSSPFMLAFCDRGYATSLTLADVTGGKAWVAIGYGGAALPPEQGGPARLLVPHLCFWKSAKGVRGLKLLLSD